MMDWNQKKKPARMEENTLHPAHFAVKVMIGYGFGLKKTGIGVVSAAKVAMQYNICEIQNK